MQRTPKIVISSRQPLNGLKTVILIKVDLEGAANTIVQHKWSQDSGRKTDTAPVDAVGKHRFNIALIQALELLGGNGQIHNNAFQKNYSHFMII